MPENNPKEKFVFFTANCSIKYENSVFPCHCGPWFDYYWDHGKEKPNCQKCKYAIEVGVVPQPEEDDNG
jgi:hypothetical protein